MVKIRSKELRIIVPFDGHTSRRNLFHRLSVGVSVIDVQGVHNFFSADHALLILLFGDKVSHVNRVNLAIYRYIDPLAFNVVYNSFIAIDVSVIQNVGSEVCDPLVLANSVSPIDDFHKIFSFVVKM